MLTTRIYLAAKLRMSGVIPPLQPGITLVETILSLPLSGC